MRRNDARRAMRKRIDVVKEKGNEMRQARQLPLRFGSMSAMDVWTPVGLGIAIWRTVGNVV